MGFFVCGMMGRYISLLLFIGVAWGQEYDPKTGEGVKKQYDPETGEVIEEVILSDDTEELKMTEEEVIENEEYMDSSEEELKSEKDLPTGQVERGEQSEVIVEGGKPRPKLSLIHI